MKDLRSSYNKVDKLLEDKEYELHMITFSSTEINYHYWDKETETMECITIIKDNVTNTTLEDF